MEVLQEFAQVRELMAEFPAGFIDSLEDALQSLDLDAAGARCEEMLMQLSSADPAPQ
jgi:hypothetical protein